MCAILSCEPNISGITFCRFDNFGRFNGHFVVGACYRVGSNCLHVLSSPLEIAAQNTFSDTGQLAFESEYCPPKGRGEILFRNPHAVSPTGKPSNVFKVRMSVGDQSVQLVATGPCELRRTIVGSIDVTSPEAVERVYLGFENGYGGTVLQDQQVKAREERNPIGKGFPVQQRLEKKCPAPQVFWVEDDGEFNPTIPSEPAGLTTVCRSWSPRRQLAGTFDEAWQRRFPLLPIDYSPNFHNSAPERLQFIQSDLQKPIRIEGLAKEPLSFVLGESYSLFVSCHEGEEPVSMVLSPETLILDAEKSLLEIRWRGLIPSNCTTKTIVALPRYAVEQQT